MRYNRSDLTKRAPPARVTVLPAVRLACARYVRTLFRQSVLERETARGRHRTGDVAHPFSDLGVEVRIAAGAQRLLPGGDRGWQVAAGFSHVANLEAATRIVHAAMPPTPQYAWPLLAARRGTEVWVKHENHTPTGAFKVRGGLVYLDGLRRGRPHVRGLVTATRGNHGQSLPYAARGTGVGVTVCVPHGNSAEKNAAMRALGAELVEVGRDFDEAREHAAQLAAERSLEMVPSFHPDLVRGVATYALELFRAAPDLDTVYVPIGMGSGICGLIRTRDLLGLSTRIVGVVSAGAPAMALSFEAGRIVMTETADTFADGIACRVPDPTAFEVIRAGADRIMRVTDGEVAAAMRAYWTDTHNLAEGAGAAPLAALLQEGEHQEVWGARAHGGDRR